MMKVNSQRSDRACLYECVQKDVRAGKKLRADCSKRQKGLLGAPEIEQVQDFKQKNDVMCLVLRAQIWLLVKNKLRGHIVEKGRVGRQPLR